MTKKLIIFAYIVGVLLLSGMVKADGVNSPDALVAQFSVNNDSGILSVAGRYASACQSDANVVPNIDNSQHVVNLRVTTKFAACNEPYVKPFSLSYDLKELNLQDGNTYRVQFGQSYRQDVVQYRAMPSNTSDDYKTTKLTKAGLLILLNETAENNKGFALRTGSEIVRLVSHDMAPELSQYLNHEVRVSGYAVEMVSMNQSNRDPLALSGPSQVNVSGESLSSTFIVPVSVGL